MREGWESKLIKNLPLEGTLFCFNKDGLKSCY